MANVTIAVADGMRVFAATTALSAYPTDQQSRSGSAPQGTASATGSLSAYTVTLTGLTSGQDYDVFGSVSGEWRRLGVHCP